MTVCVTDDARYSLSYPSPTFSHRASHEKYKSEKAYEKICYVPVKHCIIVSST